MDHKGWHSRGYLPHFDSQDVVQFVTFRLADYPTSVIGYVVSRVMLPAYATLQDDVAQFRRAFGLDARSGISP